MEKFIEAKVSETSENNIEKKESVKEKYEEINTETKDSFIKKNFKYIIIFIFGVLLTIFVISCLGGFSSKNSSTFIENDNSIGTGIKNIYDATVYIENYKKDKINISGTGFIYKKKSGQPKWHGFAYFYVIF